MEESEMKWMETIRVQSATRQEETTRVELAFLRSEIMKGIDYLGVEDVIALSHAAIPGCFALMLFWDTNDPQSKGSLLGMSLAQSLKTFGLVDHAVWIENDR
jgi:hypothetical protein